MGFLSKCVKFKLLITYKTNNMKRVIMISSFLVSFSTSIYAQEKFKVFVAANFGMSKVTFTPSIGTINRNFSGAIGAHLIYKLKPNIDLIAMPVLQQRGYTSMNGANKFDVRVSYIDIPVGVEFGFAARALIGFDKFEKGAEKPFFFGAGIYEGLAISGKYTDKYLSNPAVKIKFGESVTDQRSRTDFGLNFTLGMRFDRFRFGLQKQVGLKNVMPNSRQAKDGSIKTDNFGFFVAYNIRDILKKK